MCNAKIMDNWFGIDRPVAPETPAPTTTQVFTQASNPSAASTQSDLSPNAEGDDLKAKRKGRSSLRIDKAGSSTGLSGLNIPQA